jgi:hypothetical protein
MGADSRTRDGRGRRAVTAALLSGSLALAGCGAGADSGDEARWAAGEPSTGAPAGATPGTPGPAPTTAGPSRAGDPQQRRFTAAAALVRARPGTLGIVVRDRRTGTVWRAGDTHHPTWTASTVKLAMVVGLLERDRAGEITLDATARRQIAAMLSVSDDDAATALWNRYGKDSQLARFRQRYGMTGLTTVAGFEKFWGHLKCTAEDLQHLMTYILDTLDAADRDYILAAMRGVGAIQRWGVWAAGPAQHPGTKDGWSIEPDAGGRHWVTNAVGFAGDDARYVVAVMYHLPPGKQIGDGVHAVSDVIATVFGAPVPAPVTVPDPSTGL